MIDYSWQVSFHNRHAQLRWPRENKTFEEAQTNLEEAIRLFFEVASYTEVMEYLVGEFGMFVGMMQTKNISALRAVDAGRATCPSPQEVLERVPPAPLRILFAKGK